MKGKLTLKYDRLARNQVQPPTEGENTAIESDILMHDTEGSARSLCFVLKTGERVAYKYSLLSKLNYSPEENKITLDFSGEEVILKGETLENLFNALLLHQPKEIRVTDQRYVSVMETQPVVIEIEVKISQSKQTNE